MYACLCVISYVYAGIFSRSADRKHTSSLVLYREGNVYDPQCEYPKDIIEQREVTAYAQL